MEILGDAKDIPLKSPKISYALKESKSLNGTHPLLAVICFMKDGSDTRNPLYSTLLKDHSSMIPSIFGASVFGSV